VHAFVETGGISRGERATVRQAFSLLLVVAFMAWCLGTLGYGAERFGVRRRVRPAGPTHVPGEVIVKFKPGVGKTVVEAVHRRHGTAEIYTSRFAGFKRVRIPKGKTIAEMVAALSKEPAVRYAEPNSVCHAFAFPEDPPNDPLYTYQWHLYNAVNGGINVEPAWDVSQGDGVIVAVIDTGVAYEVYGNFRQAPDLANTTFVPGWDFVNNDAHPNDDDGHGTHVTGTIAQSTNNSLGVAGVAFNCSIMPIKVLDKKGSGAAATVADGIYFAANNGADIINMSLGWEVVGGVPYDPGQTVRDAVAYAYGQGVTIVCASGNDGEPAVGYPAAYDQYCIAVGATRYDETRPGYSNYGSSLDIAAPGGDLDVDQNSDGYADGVLQNTFGKNQNDWSYSFYDGTSMAAPHVSGVAALIIALGITDPDEVRSILESTAEDKGEAGWDSQYGHGLVDAYAAVEAAGPSTQRPVANPDTATTDEDTAVVIDVLANDTDPQNDPLTVSGVTEPANGTADINPDDTVTYTPDADFHGVDSFTYSAHDGKWDSDPATVTVTVNPVNGPPVAEDDGYKIAVSGGLSVAAPGVLENDTDGESDPLTAILVSDVTHGTLALSADGSFTYTPTTEFLGADSFTYKANDGTADSNVATVTLSVLPAYHIPDAELLNTGEDPEAFVVLTEWSDSSSTLDQRDDVAGEGVVYWITLEGADDGKIGFGDPWPTSGDAGFGWDDGLDHWTSLAAYGCYEMVISYVNGPTGSEIDVGLFLNTGLTGESGFPSWDSSNDTYWDNDWTTLSLGETKTLRLDFNDARADHIYDNKVPHTGGGQEWPDWGWYAINDRDRNEISNIGFQVADFDGDALGNAIQIALNVADPTAAQVQVTGARSEDGSVILEWETTSEVGTVGFYVVRREGAGGQAKTLGAGMLPGLLHRPQGGSYRVVDREVQVGETYTYEVVEVEAGGRKRVCGSCQVTVEKPGGGSAGAAQAKRAPDGPTYSATPRPRPEPAQKRAASRGRAPAAKAAHRPRPRAGYAVKIGVREDGLHYVAAAELAPLLAVSPKSIGRLVLRGQLSLTCRGKPVAYLPAQGGAGLYFYGQGIDSIYTDENIYWLGRGRGVLMAEAGESGAEPAAVPQTFTQAVHAEEDRCPATGLFRDPEADFWLWDYVVSGQQGGGRRAFTVRADGAALAGEATLVVHLKGATDTDAEADHHALILLNNQPIGEARWDGLDAHSVALPVEPALLLPGANTVDVEGVLDSGAPYSIFYVDSFDLVYQQLSEAVGDCLLCRAENHAVVTIGGFTQPQILVLDVTMPRRPEHVVWTTVDEGEGGYRVSFASLLPDDVYLAVTPQAAKRPSSLTCDEPSQLKHKRSRADYVMIVPGELKEAAQALAHYRRGQGLATMVAELEDIYDEFNHGIASPKAIQSFLAYACGTRRRGPRYVVLAGNGTYDYKDHLGLGGNLVPPLLMGTGYGLFAADRLFARGVAVGRLPANDAAQLAALVQKIIAYEQGSGERAKRVVMAADNADGGGNFPRDSDDLARLIPAGYTVSKVTLSGLPIGEARQQLLQGFKDGALVVNYIGHGGWDRLAQEGLLTLGDAGALNNAGRLPVVTTLSCLTGRFAVPGYDCIGDALVLQPSGGAIAFWGPSGLLLNRQSKALGKKFLRGALRPGQRVLGDVIQEAIRSGSGRASAASVDLYNLLGDPALKLRPAQ